MVWGLTQRDPFARSAFIVPLNLVISSIRLVLIDSDILAAGGRAGVEDLGRGAHPVAPVTI